MLQLVNFEYSVYVMKGPSIMVAGNNAYERKLIGWGKDDERFSNAALSMSKASETNFILRMTKHPLDLCHSTTDDTINSLQ